MPLAAEQFQAWSYVDTGDHQYWARVGEAQATEAAAWREVHNVGAQFWPENSGRRRIFESRCNVDPVIKVEVR